MNIQQVRQTALPLSLPPRGLSRREAAEYIGIGTTKFDELVSDGRMPKPIRFDSRTVWDRLEIDEAFTALCETSVGNDWDNI